MGIKNELDPLMSLLQIAQERQSVEQGSYICTVVRDAQIIRHHPERTREIERATYRYSVTLGRSSADFLDGMNATALTKKDIVKLLEFFRSL